MGNTHILGLRAIDLIAEDPAARGAMGIHPAAAIIAFAAGGDAGNENVIALMEGSDAGAGFLDHADPFVTEDAPGRA